VDGVYSMAKGSLNSLLSGSADGEIRLWNLSSQKTSWKVKPFQSLVQGLCFVPSELHKFVCVGEKTIHLFDTSSDSTLPLSTFLSTHIFNSVDHHRHERIFATASSVIQLWDHSRYEYCIASIVFIYEM
jgi:WD repeat and SOF domain-containing protein 1